MGSVPVRFDYDLPDGMWAFLASRLTYASLANCLNGTVPDSIVPLEITCHDLEERGLLYAAQLAHLNTAAICFFLGNRAAMDAHALRAAAIGHSEGYLFPMAVDVAYAGKHLTQSLAAFPEEYSSLVLRFGEQIHQGYQAVVRASGESHVFSNVDKADLEYVAYAVRGLTNKEIADMLGLSAVTVSKKYSSICQKLSLGSKRELTTVAKATLSRYDIHLHA